MAPPTMQPSRSDSEIAPSSPPVRPVRPTFHHRYTDDRLREGVGKLPSFSMQSNIRKDRRSIFKELGLDTDCGATYEPLLSDKEFAEITGLTSAGSDRPSDYNNSERAKGNSAGNRRLQKAQRPRDNHSDDPTSSPQSATSTDSKGWFTKLVAGRRPRIKTAASAPPPTMSSFTRLTSVALFVAVVIPGFSYYNGQEKVALNGADAGVIRRKPDGPVLETRADSPKLCKRWSHQSAHLNGTLYIYGGQASATEGQTSDTWSEFLEARNRRAVELTHHSR